MKGINLAVPIIAGNLQKICIPELTYSILSQFNIIETRFLLIPAITIFASENQVQLFLNELFQHHDTSKNNH